MKMASRCGGEQITLSVPDDTEVYETRFPAPAPSAAAAVLEAVRTPIGCPALAEAVRDRRRGDVVVVVSDATRPVPYAQFLPELLGEVEAAGVARDEILVLVATGMHRPSTPEERSHILGPAADRYRVEDHRAEDEAGLSPLPGRSWAGTKVRLNRHYLEAGFRLITGLVEPHFMAGFSGGRKGICPGLASLDTIRHFHGAEFMGDERASNGRLAGNPCHEEALSVARMAPPDFSLDVVLDSERRVVRAFAGQFEAAHEQACELVRACACPPVARPADVVVTSSGGYPLDATFYQCVKGFVSCLPAVRQGGTVVSFGGCAEGVGSPEYAGLMQLYTGRWADFLADIRKPGVFTKDQWQFQMHARALARVGQANLHFVTGGLPQHVLDGLSVTGHSVPKGQVGPAVQELVDRLAGGGRTVAILPEGPYCAALPAGGV